MTHSLKLSKLFQLLSTSMNHCVGEKWLRTAAANYCLCTLPYSEHTILFKFPNLQKAGIFGAKNRRLLRYTIVASPFFASTEAHIFLLFTLNISRFLCLHLLDTSAHSVANLTETPLCVFCISHFSALVDGNAIFTRLSCEKVDQMEKKILSLEFSKILIKLMNSLRTFVCKCSKMGNKAFFFFFFSKASKKDRVHSTFYTNCTENTT